MKNMFFYKTPIGEIGIAEEDGSITNVFFIDDDFDAREYTVIETNILAEANKQLQEYFQGKRKDFSLPFSPKGTDFMQSVWKCLCTIPYGETRSYKDVAENIGNPKACRAVGLANNRNPIPIFIPCHRVVGASGKLVGYAGGLEVKEHLLNLEK